MECPECGKNTKVLESRKYAGGVYRRRKCIECGFMFWTEEIEMEDNLKVVKHMRDFIKTKYQKTIT